MKGIEEFYIETGRNDPCPCGSGKKYKRCCLPLLEDSLFIDSLKIPAYYKVTHHSFTNYREFFKDTMRKFDKEYLASVESLEDLVMLEEGWLEPLDWFIFNEYILKGKTPLQLFLEEGDATEREKDILKRFDGTYWSIYEVKELIKGLSRAKFIDLFSKKEYLVFDKNISSVEDGMIVFCRLVPYDRFHFVGYVFTPWLLHRSEKFEEILDDFIGPLRRDNLSVEEILRVYGYRLYLFIKTLTTYEDEESADVVTSIYKVKDHDKIISLLQLSPYFYRQHILSESEIFTCLRNPRSELLINTTEIITSEEEETDESSLGLVRVEKDYLEILAPTKKRLEAIRTLLEELVGDYITLEDVR